MTPMERAVADVVRLADAWVDDPMSSDRAALLMAAVHRYRRIRDHRPSGPPRAFPEEAPTAPSRRGIR